MKLITYTTKSGSAADNRTHIATFMKALHAEALPDLDYTVLETGDGSFFHIVKTTEAGSAALRKVPAFSTFIATLGERQQAEPIVSEVSVVGSYGRLIGA